ncbi:MAG: MotA/TolQ/ExbB proton channel family protein [Leptospirales bacterium]|nr:MotA/TolQ/ExbB proton channel family protein [Leptospirales bacterium]
MAEFFSWSGLISAGGPALIVLLLCSLVSLIVIVERAVYFNARKADPAEVAREALHRLDSGVSAASLSEDPALRRHPLGYVLAECLAAPHPATDPGGYEEVRSRAIAERLPEMERYLGIEATLGTVSPYIGLLGTVLGIIRAFLSLGAGAGGETAGMNQLNAGIAEALIATAAGLFVAIPATIAYNYFRKRVSDMVLQMEIAASRLKSGLASRAAARS